MVDSLINMKEKIAMKIIIIKNTKIKEVLKWRKVKYNNLGCKNKNIRTITLKSTKMKYILLCSEMNMNQIVIEDNQENNKWICIKTPKIKLSNKN